MNRLLKAVETCFVLAVLASLVLVGPWGLLTDKVICTDPVVKYALLGWTVIALSVAKYGWQLYRTGSNYTKSSQATIL
jgi:hypothetical protein